MSRGQPDFSLEHLLSDGFQRWLRKIKESASYKKGEAQAEAMTADALASKAKALEEGS